MYKGIAVCAAVFAALPLASACGGPSAKAFPIVNQSESEVAQALVDAGLLCEDSDKEVSPSDGIRVTRWDCVNEGSEHPYFDVFYYVGDALEDDTLAAECGYLLSDSGNDGVLQLSAVNFTMYSSAALEVNSNLTSMEVASINADIEETLRSVGDVLGLSPLAPSELCS